MKVIIDILEDDFGIDIQDKFQEFFENVKVDIGHGITYHDTLLCGDYEERIAEMFLASFKRMRELPDEPTNGDMIEVIFNCKLIGVSKGKVYVEGIYFPFNEDWWNAPYKKEE